MADGWQRMRQSAAAALTRFRRTGQANVSAKAEVDDDVYLPSPGWSMLGGDVFEDERRLVVRLEVPGMDKDEFDIEVLNDALVVNGEKRFARERTHHRGRRRWVLAARIICRPGRPMKTPRGRVTYSSAVSTCRKWRARTDHSP